MTETALSNSVETLVISGEISSPTFMPWVARHSRRLGLKCATKRIDATRVELRVEGQADLIDALEVGCLLGPFDVWVESIERRPATLSD